MKAPPKLYETGRCWLTNGFDNFSRTPGITIERYNIEHYSDAEQFVNSLNGGKIKFPMVIVRKT